MKKIRLLASVGILVVTLAVGLTSITQANRAEAFGECNCDTRQGPGNWCRIDGYTYCCNTGCYVITE